MLKVDMVYEQLKGAILSGKAKPGEKLPSSLQLSQNHKVAHMTMRKALKRLEEDGFLELLHGKGVFVKKNPQVKHAALVLNSQADIHAMFPHLLQQELNQAGYYVSLFELETLADHSEMFLDFFCQPHDLLIFDGSLAFPWELLERIPKGVRKIVIHRDECKKDYILPCVLKDVEACAFLAVTALLALGKRRIAVLGDEYLSKSHAYKNFIKGAARAVEKHELIGCVEFNYFSEHTSEDEWGRIYKQDVVYDGVIGGRDNILVPVFLVITRLGMRIPEQVALVGCNNTPWAELLHFSSIDIRPQEIVTQLGLLLTDHASNQRVVVEPEIIFRQSCPDSM